MIVKAKQSTTWITPRKLRPVADAIRGKSLAEVNVILSSLNKRGAQVINETIRQAVANAVNNFGLAEETLTLKTVMINEGPKFRRFRAGARGQAKPYALRTSHVVVELESPDAQEKAPKASPVAKAEPTQAAAQEEAVKSSAKAKSPAKKTTAKKTAPSTTAKTTAKKAPATKPAAKKTTKKSTTKKEVEK